MEILHFQKAAHWNYTNELVHWLLHLLSLNMVHSAPKINHNVIVYPQILICMTHDGIKVLNILPPLIVCHEEKLFNLKINWSLRKKWSTRSSFLVMSSNVLRKIVWNHSLESPTSTIFLWNKLCNCLWIETPPSFGGTT